MHTQVAIVGAGNVGSTFAYMLLLSGLAAEIVLIDANRVRAEGEAMDQDFELGPSDSEEVLADDPDLAEDDEYELPRWRATSTALEMLCVSRRASRSASTSSSS